MAVMFCFFVSDIQVILTIKQVLRT